MGVGGVVNFKAARHISRFFRAITDCEGVANYRAAVAKDSAVTKQ
jgi:hypothetical protein